MKIEIELTESEARLLSIICDTHEMDDEEQKRAYLLLGKRAL